jgi:hypothetical protein
MALASAQAGPSTSTKTRVPVACPNRKARPERSHIVFGWHFGEFENPVARPTNIVDMKSRA